jgi:hypothetical protein
LLNIVEKQANNDVAFDIEKKIRPCTFDMIVGEKQCFYCA